MFIRTKKSPNTNKISVQIVKNVRKDGKVRQSIVRRIGKAKKVKVCVVPCKKLNFLRGNKLKSFTDEVGKCENFYIHACL